MDTNLLLILYKWRALDVHIKCTFCNLKFCLHCLSYLHPSYLPAYPATDLPIYLPSNLPTSIQTHLSTYPVTFLPVYLPTNIPTYLPTYIHIYLHTYLTTHTYIILLGSFLSYPTLPFLVPIEVRFGMS